MTVRASKISFNLREKLKELTHTIGNKGRELMRAATAQEARTLISAGRRNILINGAMRIAQRGTSATGVTGNGYNTVDRWRTSLNTAGTWTVEQDTDAPPGFEYSLKYSCTSTASIVSGSYFVTYQLIEANNCQVMKNNVRGSHPLTLSFWVKASKTGTASWEIQQIDNASRRFATSYTINKPDTWEKKVIRIPADPNFVVDDNNAAGIRIGWWWNGGATYSTGDHGYSWRTNNNANRNVRNFDLGTSTDDYVAITGAQLEVGENATEYDHLPYQEELNNCLRYYWKVKGNSSDQVAIGAGQCRTNAQVQTYIHFPVPMRAISENADVTESDMEAIVGGSVYQISKDNSFDEGLYTIGLALSADTGTPFTAANAAIIRLKQVTSAFFAVDAELN